MMPGLTLALEREDGCFRPGETIRGHVVWRQAPPQGGQPLLQEARVVVTLTGGVHVEWEEGGHSGDDTGALRYVEDRAVFPEQTQTLSGPRVDDDGATTRWALALPIPTRIPPTVALPRPNGPVVGVTYTLAARLFSPSSSSSSSSPLEEGKRAVCVLPTEDGCLDGAAPGVRGEVAAAVDLQEESAALTTLCCFLPRGRVRTRITAPANSRVVHVPFSYNDNGGSAGGGGGVTVGVALRVENTASVPLSRVQARLYADVWMSDGEARHTFEDRFLVAEQDLSGGRALAPGQTLALDGIAFSRLKPALPSPPGATLDPHRRDDALQAPSLGALGLLRLGYTVVVSAQYPTLLPLLPSGPVILAKLPVLFLPSSSP